jgi:hypothetical protein
MLACDGHELLHHPGCLRLSGFGVVSKFIAVLIFVDVLGALFDEDVNADSALRIRILSLLGLNANVFCSLGRLLYVNALSRYPIKLCASQDRSSLRCFEAVGRWCGFPF